MIDRRDSREYSERADLVLDITLWVEIALLALVLLQWHPPVRPFPPIFGNTPTHTR